MLPAAFALLVTVQSPVIGIVDFYGLRTVTERQVRAALGMKEGDSLPQEIDTPKQRLAALPNVARADLEFVCCEHGRYILYVGITERGAPTLEFRPAPTGVAGLPDVVAEAAVEYDTASQHALAAGDFAEEQSKGYALSHFPALRTVQQRFPGFADRYARELRTVLQESADAAQRATAARVLGYASDKQSVVDDLVAAIRDPDENTRNNAMRALWVFGLYAQRAPAHLPRVPAAPLVAMLNSPVWTDRNKASLALAELTADRDSATLAAIRREALPALLDMARWHAPGHAYAGFFLLGRAVGVGEKQLKAAWARGDREMVIAAARRAPTR